MASSHFAASIKRRLPADDEGKDPRNKRKDGRSPQGFKQLCCCLHTLSRLRGKCFMAEMKPVIPVSPDTHALPFFLELVPHSSFRRE
uniref:Uncharacterized protein n=1 Tax=Knipowitschia caucasica TaxID=637954 RepID=A0AAV2LLL8_KNICA